MTPEATYALMRRQGWHLVAAVLEDHARTIPSVTVRVDFDRQVGQLGSRLADAGCATEGRPTPVNPDWQAYPDSEPCARESGWCDGVICRNWGLECPNADVVDEPPAEERPPLSNGADEQLDRDPLAPQPATADTLQPRDSAR